MSCTITMPPISCKRKRSSSVALDWSGVPYLLLDLILSKLSCSLQDCLALAGTCRHWRSAAKQSNTSIRTDLLMPITTIGLYEYQTTASADTALRVFHSSTKEFRLSLPEITGFLCFGSRFGWLVAYRPRTGLLQSKVMLFNPFTRSSLSLPDLKGLFEFHNVVNAVRLDWSAIPYLLLDLILSKLSCSLQDCLALAGTCRHWRSAAKQSNTSIRTDLLMPITTIGLYEYQTTASADTALRVFHSSTKEFRLSLPEITGFLCFGSRFGWLVAYRPRTGLLQSKVMLFNPFTRSSLSLPDLKGLFEFHNVVNAVLTASPAHDDDCLVVVEYMAGSGKLAFTRPRSIDAVWRPISRSGLFNPVCLNKTLYCLRFLGPNIFNNSWRFVSYDLSSSISPLKEAPIAPPPHDAVSGNEMLTKMWMRNCRVQVTYHLVEIRGKLCMVVRFLEDEKYSSIQIFELEAGTNEWSRVGSLGNSCLVVQDKQNMTLVDASQDPKLIPGCIYYTIENSNLTVIHYPSTTTATDQISTMSWIYEYGRPLKRHEDTYSKIYPSILLLPDRLSSCIQAI